ncbi:hypothetical protein [Nocardioides sp.]|uniref:hypothetical protein n=1 Tax=Nocardioides sp. TaxID=35761 RepID=UPI00356AAE64
MPPRALSGPLAVPALTLAVVLALGLVGCRAGGGDPVVDSVLPAGERVVPAGPAYLAQELKARAFHWSVVVGGESRELGRLDDATWLADGRVLARPSGSRLQVIDPVTGEVEAERRINGQWGVTPEAITVRHDRRNRIVVLATDLTRPRTIDVPDSAVETDQLEEDTAELSLHHAAYTLAGVTWVQWGINSEDDTRTDHGVLRIEDGVPTEVLRDEPVVSLLPSRDGAALLVLMQDNGEDQSCGGCVVEQTIVELDPATGEVAAEYGMPDGYERSWRVETLDKIGSEVVARFVIGEAEEAGDPGVARQTWTYDGDWTQLGRLDEVRTWWQPGGRLEWQQRDTLRDEGELAAMRLSWLPRRGAPVELYGESRPCREREGVERCPLIVAPGGLLPAG